MVVLSVDPGRRKCGVAVVSTEEGILHRRIVPREEVGPSVRQIVGTYAPVEVLVGGSTGSREVVEELKAQLARDIRVVDERHTTERARRRFYQDHPPRGLWRLVPLGLQVPPVPYDDYAAVVMAEDYLAGLGSGPPSET